MVQSFTSPIRIFLQRLQRTTLRSARIQGEFHRYKKCRGARNVPPSHIQQSGAGERPISWNMESECRASVSLDRGKLRGGQHQTCHHHTILIKNFQGIFLSYHVTANATSSPLLPKGGGKEGHSKPMMSSCQAQEPSDSGPGELRNITLFFCSMPETT